MFQQVPIRGPVLVPVLSRSRLPPKTTYLVLLTPLFRIRVELHANPVDNQLLLAGYHGSCVSAAQSPETDYPTEAISKQMQG